MDLDELLFAASVGHKEERLVMIQIWPSIHGKSVTWPGTAVRWSMFFTSTVWGVNVMAGQTKPNQTSFWPFIFFTLGSVTIVLAPPPSLPSTPAVAPVNQSSLAPSSYDFLTSLLYAAQCRVLTSELFSHMWLNHKWITGAKNGRATWTRSPTSWCINGKLYWQR